MLEVKKVAVAFGHSRTVCPECFEIIAQCPCGGDQRHTTWELCNICMKREPEAAKYAEKIPEGTLLDARLVFRKILPILNYPKEFIPVRLHPGYDQWKETLIQDILLSTVSKTTGAEHERKATHEDPGSAPADRSGAGGEPPAASRENQK